MTWRVVYTKPGHIFPDHHDFAYRKAADDWDALCRAGGWETEVVEIGGDGTERPGNRPRDAADRAKVPEGHREGDSAPNRRTGTEGDE